MAQLIVPSVDLQLQSQYAQHYASDTGVPFQINPANELKPVAEAMKAFAQYDARVKESESNIEAQNALNEFNEYKSKRLTDLQQMPLGKAVDAYAGLDTDLELFAKQSGAKINSARAKAKFDASIGSALSNGRAQGYAVHAQQVTRHEEKVDSATIDLASQDVASKVGTPEYQTAMESFKGTIGVFSNKYGFTSEEATAFERNETKKIFINAGNNLITTEQFGKCAEMLHDNKGEMDSFTYNDISAKLKAGMEAAAKRREAEARQKANEAKSEINANYAAALAAKDHAAADIEADKMKAYSPTLGQLMGERVALLQAGDLNEQIKTGMTIGRDSQAEINMLSSVLPRVAPEARAAFIDDLFVAGDKQTTLAQKAEQEAQKAYLEREKNLYETAKKYDQPEKAAEHAINVYMKDPVQGDLFLDGLNKDQQDKIKAQIKEQLADTEKELGKWIEAGDWKNATDRILEIAKYKPNLARAWLGALDAKQKAAFETEKSKRLTAAEKNFNAYLEAGETDKAYGEYQKIDALDREHGNALLAKLNKKAGDLKQTAQDNQVKRLDKLIDNYAAGDDYKTVGALLAEGDKIDPQYFAARRSKFSKEQLDAIEQATNKEKTRLTSLFDESMKSESWDDAKKWLTELAKYDLEGANAKFKTLSKTEKEKFIAHNKEQYQQFKELYDEHVKANEWEKAAIDLAGMRQFNELMADAKGLTLNKEVKDALEKDRAKQEKDIVSLINKNKEAKRYDKMADNIVALGAINSKEADAWRDVALKMQGDDAEKLKKELASRYETLHNHYVKAGNYDEAYKQLESLNKIDHEKAIALQAETAKSQADYATKMRDLAVETQDQELAQRADATYQQAKPLLTEEEQARNKALQEKSVGNNLLKQAEKVSSKNVGLAANICQQIISSPNADEASKTAAKQMISQFEIDKVLNQCDMLLKTEQYRDFAAAMYTKNEKGERVPSELANRIYDVSPEKYADFMARYEKGNVGAEEKRIENVRKNKGLPDDELKLTHDKYISSMLDGNDGAVDVYFKEHGVANPTDYQRATIRAKLAKEIDGQAWQYANKVSDEVWEKNTAEGAQFFSAYRSAQALYNQAIMATPEARHRGLTTTNAFSQIPQDKQNELLKMFGGDSAKEKEFIEYFNNMNKNHAVGNPQTYQRVLLDIKANKYLDEPQKSMQTIMQNHSDLDPEQLNQIEKELKEHTLELKGQNINSQNSYIKNFFANKLYGSDFADLDKGSPEQKAVMTATAKMNMELDRRLGFNASIDAYEKEFAVLLTDKSFMKQVSTSILQAKTQDDLSEDFDDAVEDSKVTLSEAQERGVAGRYSLEESAVRRSFHYPFTFAGMQEYISDARHLGGNYQRLSREAKDFVDKYFTDEEKKRYEMDKQVYLKKVADMY